MYWTSGTINVYRCWINWHNGTTQSIVTAHCVPVTPGGIYDNCSGAAAWMAYTYGQVVGTTCNVVTSDPIAYAAPLAVRINSTPEANHVVSGGLGPINTTCPEAAFLMRREGAGPVGPRAGRARFGPLPLSFFTDPPRYRKIANTNMPISTAITHLENTQATGGAFFYDVLWDRRRAVAVLVDTYDVPVRTGRVWQRAGYPQGKRGPDRH